MKQIFVGSSSKAETHMATICRFVNEVARDKIKALPWRASFPLGLPTFQALERMLQTCSGAILVASPEVEGSPTPNVMLEFGLVAGRMGLSNVVLCKVDDVRIPSDLYSLTHIELKTVNQPEELHLSSEDQYLLRDWLTSLPETLKGIPTTNLVHGYTGRWDVKLKFDRWRDYPMTGKRFATMDGRLDLIIPPDGQHGFGLGQGDVFVYFPHEDSTGLETAADPLYEARFRTCWQAEEVRCQPSGEITYKARSLIRTCIGKPIGHLPDGGTLAQSDVTPWTFTWVLTPDLTNEFRMTIAVKTDVAVWSSASGEAEKHLGRYL